MLQTIMKWLVYAALAFLVLVGAFVVALFAWNPGEHARTEEPARSEQPAAYAPAVNPEWPGASFPSDAWKSSELEWYIQWKRVRKYARIAFQTLQPAGLVPLKSQARDLWENVAGWQDGRPRSACLPAAEELHKAISTLQAGDAGGALALEASEASGDKCRTAAQAASRRR